MARDEGGGKSQLPATAYQVLQQLVHICLASQKCKTKEISSGLFYIQTSDDRFKKNVLKCWIHGVCSRDVCLELKAATSVLLEV